jgi:TolA-binding protein
MKKTLQIMMLALLAFGMMACGEKTLTQDDLKKAERTLFDKEGNINSDVAPAVAEKYCEFVEQNPNDSTATLWLYHALEINVMLKDVEKSEAVCNKLIEMYPTSRYAPRALYLLGSFIYEDELKDLDKARETYERIINDYPDSELIPSVEKSIEYLGMSPDEIMSLIMMNQMPEDD